MTKLYEYQLDEDMDLNVLVKQADVRTAKNGKPFIAFTFQDKSGAMDGKYWGATDEDITHFQAGRVVHLSGKREVYKGQPQVRINRLVVVKEEEQKPALYMESAPMTTDDMKSAIQSYLFKITNAPINRIVRHILTEHADTFFSFPAAKKHHHAFPGGLGFHTISILRLADKVAELYPDVDPSLLFGGAILHDIGKTIELTGAIGTEYTVKGNLLGHIVIIDEEITRACLALKISEDSEAVVLLKHMILSHHGLLEYGSPVRPHLLEAEILHELDMIDASINMITTSLAKTPAGHFGERIFGLDGRSFYKPLLEK